MQVDPRLVHGVELFNKREFFDCHEVLEELWNDQNEPEKQLTQGIIQIAVAYYHYLNGNSRGATKLLARGLPRVKPFAPRFAGLQLTEFVRQVEHDFALLSKSEAEAVDLLIPLIGRDK